MDNQNTGKLVMLPISKIIPHPDNPRKDLGDLTELAASINLLDLIERVGKAQEGKS